MRSSSVIISKIKKAKKSKAEAQAEAKRKAEAEAEAKRKADEAKKKADAETDAALQSINAEKQKAVKEIKTAAVDLSIKAASKLIEKNLDTSDNRKLVSDAIDKVGQA